MAAPAATERKDALSLARALETEQRSGQAHGSKLEEGAAPN
jgi:hypothetical protein